MTNLIFIDEATVKLALEVLKIIKSSHDWTEESNAAIKALEEALAKQEQGEPVAFLANGVRFKLNFDSKGRVSSLWNYLSELDGRWVALVAAEDDCHLKLTAPKSQQNLSNQLVGALAHTPEADFWRWWEPYELKDCWRIELVARDAWMAAKENK
jgi:hypothetical protein